jgi:fucose permease
LLGCILPALSLAWHLNDRRAGILFAAQFTGSALGALLVSKDFFRSLVNGYVAMIAGTICLSFFSGILEVAFFFAFGIGLGLAITSSNMLFASTLGENRGAALSVLNAVWGLGAVLSPLIAQFWVARWRPEGLFLALSAALTVTFFSIARERAAFVSFSGDVPRVGRHRQLRLVSLFAVIAFLYVGTEVCVSGWMMSYVGRLPISNKLWAAAATSSFWIALIFGRTLVPVVVQWVPEAQLFTASIAAALVAVLLLIVSRGPLAILLSAMSAGLMLAPTFPLCLARVLTLMQDSPRSKWVFSVSGLGGAFLPWITGEISAHNGSLRVGLLVPVFALGGIVILDRLGSGLQTNTALTSSRP